MMVITTQRPAARGLSLLALAWTLAASAFACGGDGECDTEAAGAEGCVSTGSEGTSTTTSTATTSTSATTSTTTSTTTVGPHVCSYGDPVALDAGGGHTCVVFDSGDVSCWGRGVANQLGYGLLFNVGDDELPSLAGCIDSGGVVTGVTAGMSHTCAVYDDATTRCWGSDEFGKLGYAGINLPQLFDTPADLDTLNLGGGVAALSAGGNHTCALLEGGGDVRCWGLASSGELGTGSEEDIGDDEHPADIDPVALGGPATAVTAGDLFTCALLEDGDVRCWGRGSSGLLGLGDTQDIGDDELPTSVEPVSLGARALAVSAGERHTCALLESGQVRCWGVGGDGQLGIGSTDNVGDDELPTDVDVVALSGPATQISAGGFHTCALLESGDVQCWGRGLSGRLGYGSTENVGDDELPTDAGVVALGGGALQVSAGSRFTCALMEDRTVRCWGEAEDGQLGQGNTDDIGDEPGEMPPPAVALE